MTDHHMTLHTVHDRVATLPKFWGSCTCGWKSDVVSAAGMVHGSYATHRYQEPAHEEEEAPADEDR